MGYTQVIGLKDYLSSLKNTHLMADHALTSSYLLSQLDNGL